MKGCGGMARKICFLRQNVKGWSSSKEFIGKEVDMDLADVEVKFGKLEAELSETNAVNDKLQRSYYELVEYKLLDKAGDLLASAHRRCLRLLCCRKSSLLIQQSK